MAASKLFCQCVISACKACLAWSQIVTHEPMPRKHIWMLLFHSRRIFPLSYCHFSLQFLQIVKNKKTKKIKRKKEQAECDIKNESSSRTFTSTCQTEFRLSIYNLILHNLYMFLSVHKRVCVWLGCFSICFPIFPTKNFIESVFLVPAFGNGTEALWARNINFWVWSNFSNNAFSVFISFSTHFFIVFCQNIASIRTYCPRFLSGRKNTLVAIENCK